MLGCLRKYLGSEQTHRGMRRTINNAETALCPLEMYLEPENRTSGEMCTRTRQRGTAWKVRSQSKPPSGFLVLHYPAWKNTAIKVDEKLSICGLPACVRHTPSDRSTRRLYFRNTLLMSLLSL